MANEDINLLEETDSEVSDIDDTTTPTSCEGSCTSTCLDECSSSCSGKCTGCTGTCGGGLSIATNVPSLLATFDYNMEEQGPDLTSYDSDIITFSGDLTAFRAGDYTITASLVDPENYMWDDGTTEPKQLKWSIKCITSDTYPYADTIVIKEDAFKNLLTKIKGYFTAGHSTGIRLVPNKEGTRLQIQNMRSVEVRTVDDITYLYIIDPTDIENPEKRYQISGTVSFKNAPSHPYADADMKPGMFNMYENKALSQTVMVTGFTELGDLYMPENIITGQKVRGAVFNDYAEYRESIVMQPGVCVVETGYGDLERSTKRLQLGAAITSDTFGFSIGQTDKAQTPIAVCGRVLAYPYEDRYEFTAGAAVCSAPDGKVSLMTREEIKEWPDAIVGYVSEIPEYDYWGSEKIYVNGRIWIKVK